MFHAPPKKVQGVYVITNIVNGKQYVGCSSDIRRRFWEHKSHSKTVNYVIYKAIRKYGHENFKMEIVEHVGVSIDLPNKERYWIARLKPVYNMNEGGCGNPGRTVSEAQRENLRQAGRRQWARMSSEEKQRIIKSQLTGPKPGHVVSKETREKLRLINLGKRQSVETVRKRAAKISVSMIGNQSGNKKIKSILKGVTIKVYESTKKAAVELGVNPSCITGVLKGRRKHCRGFEWKYV